MNARNNRVVTYLSDKYKSKLLELCKDREEKEATIVREIIMEFLEHKNHFGISKEKTAFKTTAAYLG